MMFSEVNGVLLEQVASFRYLDSLITKDGRSVTEIAMARKVFWKLKELIE